MQVLAALFVLVPFCYLSGAFAINPVVEEASSAHHLQLLSGCPPVIYWAGSYVSLPPCLRPYFPLNRLPATPIQQHGAQQSVCHCHRTPRHARHTIRRIMLMC